MSRPNVPRDPIAGPPTPQPPFPLKLRGPVIKGFGRGSKDLGIPTANIPPTSLSTDNQTLTTGIYYGYASLDHSTIPTLTTPSTIPSATPDTTLPTTRSSNHAVADLEGPPTEPPSRPLTPRSRGAGKVYPTVLSIGYNPYYKNTQRSIEIHLLHSFGQDFYGATLSLVILGYIRPEYDYVSKEALVEDIREDIRVAQRSLARPAYEEYMGDEWLRGQGAESMEGEGLPADGVPDAAHREEEKRQRQKGQIDVLAKHEMDP